MIIDRHRGSFGYEQQGYGMRQESYHGPSGMQMHMMRIPDSDSMQLSRPHMYQSGSTTPWPGQNMYSNGGWPSSGGHYNHTVTPLVSPGGMSSNGMMSSRCETYKIDVMPGRRYEDMRYERRGYGPDGRYYQYDEGTRRDGCNTVHWVSKGV